MFGITFEPKVDIGTFISGIAITAAFLSWAGKSLVSWIRNARKEARSGALRVLLKLLRERSEPVKLKVLYDDYQSDVRKNLRRSYCKQNLFVRDYKFKDEATFEAAIYSLDWEGKIDFNSPNEVSFRLDRRYVAPRGSRTLRAAPEIIDKVVATVEAATKDPKTQRYDLDPLFDAVMRLAPERGAALLKAMLDDSDLQTRQRAASMIGRFQAEEQT